jgi:hypothetical protein
MRGYTIILQKANARQEEVQNSTISRKSDVDTFLGCTKANLEHYIESCTAVNSVHFSEMLWDQLKAAI